jgi:hypothetical protein
MKDKDNLKLPKRVRVKIETWSYEEGWETISELEENVSQLTFDVSNSVVPIYKTPKYFNPNGNLEVSSRRLTLWYEIDLK